MREILRYLTTMSASLEDEEIKGESVNAFNADHEKHLGVKIQIKRLKEDLRRSNDGVIKLSKHLGSKDEIFNKKDIKMTKLKKID